MAFKTFLFYSVILNSGSVANAFSAQPWPDSTIHSILLPSDPPPMDPEDSYECVFENVTQYYDPPKPTGALLDALFDYGDAIFQACEEATGADTYDCYPEKEEWCKFNIKRPDKVSEDLSAWGSTVSSWWAEHSSKAVEVAQECPQYWFEAGLGSFDMRTWLNKTVIFAGCGEGSLLDVDSTTTTMSDTLIGTTTTGAAMREDKTSATSTSTTKPDQDGAAVGLRKLGWEGLWMVAACNVVAAMANAML